MTRPQVGAVSHAIITVRAGSSRLPRKCFLEFGSGTVLDHVITRAKWAGFEPLVCTTVEREDDEIVEAAVRAGVLCHRGSVEDKLDRWRGACEQFAVEDFHTMDADDPFIDPTLARRSIELLRSGGLDYVSPSSRSYLASVGYSITRAVVEKACAAKTTTDTEMMWYHVENVPGVRSAELDVADARIRDVRLTLDYEEDYWLLRSLLRILGPEAERPEIEDLFLRNPALSAVNWFRNEGWKQAQEARRP